MGASVRNESGSDGPCRCAAKGDGVSPPPPLVGLEQTQPNEVGLIATGIILFIALGRRQKGRYSAQHLVV